MRTSRIEWLKVNRGVYRAGNFWILNIGGLWELHLDLGFDRWVSHRRRTLHECQATAETMARETPLLCFGTITASTRDPSAGVGCE